MFTRIRQGWELTKKAWGVVRSNPKLVRLPVTGGVLALVAALVLATPGIALVATQTTAAQVVGVLLIAVGSYLASFLVIFYNVALAAAADEALQGRDPDLTAAKDVARSRIRVIAAWALVSAVVSLALSALRDRGGLIGDIAASIGAAVWSLVTFLVVPVLAFEDIGPIDAIKRSTQLVRQRWGQQVAGNLAIGGISGLVILAGGAFVVLGIVLLTAGSISMTVLGAVLIVAGLSAAVAGAVFAGATRGVFGVALYHFVVEDRAIGPFTAPELEGAARAR